MEAQNTSRIDHISRMIFEIASGNYNYHVDRTENEDELDAIVVGINMLREELKATTVSRDYMNNLIEGVVDLIFILDKNFVIQSVNEAVVDLLGYKEADLTGKDFISVLEKNSVIALDSVQRSLADNRFIKDIELRIGTHSDHVIPTSSSFSILYDKGVESGILIIAKDISRLKKAEDEMRKAKEHAEAANVAKSRFLANMSHEIRTPLNGILGIAEIMASEIKDPTQREYIDIMRTSGKNLAKLINDILDLSKIESGKLALEKMPFAFSETIKNNLQSYRYLAEQKGLAFTCDIDENIPSTIVGDSTRINQIVANLIGNAIKFTEKGSVGLRFRVLGRHQGEVTLLGEVKDTGIGIPEEKKKIIFESFAQADDSVTRKYGGTGLGLSIVENLVHQMGGQINVESPNEGSGIGTVFKFTIKVAVPVSQALSSNISKEGSANLAGDALRILVVDDNNINQLVARKILEKYGSHVTLAASAQEAIDLVKTTNFDLIFMDIQMPGMDGYEATAEIRKMNFKNPIIALSANAYNEHVQRSIEAGMDGHLQKPFAPHEIQAIVTKCINDKRKGKVAA